MTDSTVVSPVVAVAAPDDDNSTASVLSSTRPFTVVAEEGEKQPTSIEESSPAPLDSEGIESVLGPSVAESSVVDVKVDDDDAAAAAQGSAAAQGTVGGDNSAPPIGGEAAAGPRQNGIHMWWSNLTSCGDEGANVESENRDEDGIVAVARDAADDCVAGDSTEKSRAGSNEDVTVTSWWQNTTKGWGSKKADGMIEEKRDGGDSSQFKKRTYEKKNRFASWLVPADLLQASDILTDTMAESHRHGIIDVKSKYPAMAIFQSVYILAKLQRARYIQEQRSALTAEEKAASLVNTASTGNPLPKPSEKDPSDELLSNLARYSAFASAAYGWKVQVALSGKVHGSNLSALLAKTGVKEKDVVSCRWESELHRPAYFLVRDHARRSVVLCIRGTITTTDVVTDLFFEEDGALRDEDDRDVFTAKMGRGQKAPAAGDGDTPSSVDDVRAHQGMVHSAREIARETRLLVEAELSTHDGYRLVLTGHSMGGGAAAILGSFWRTVFPDVVVYIFGCPCVSPLNSRLADETNVVSVMREGDPFSTLSLGHVADLSHIIAEFCEDAELRASAMKRLKNRHVNRLSKDDLLLCCTALSALREKSTAEKFYPCGQLYYISGLDVKHANIKKVEHSKFDEMLVHKHMTDLSRHYFSNYEKVLNVLWEKRNSLIMTKLDI